MRRMSISRRDKQGGFTLIELMMVVVILGLVSAIAIPIYARSLRRAQRTALMAEAACSSP